MEFNMSKKPRLPRQRVVLGRHDGHVLFRTYETRKGIDGTERPYIIGTFRMTEAQFSALN